MDSKLIYLVQTDTTVGFSSSSDERLSEVKQRPSTQKILQVVDSFKTLQQNARIPKKFRRKVRQAKRTTFIYPNTHSFRVINKDDKFHPFVKKFGKIYSTSANLTGNKFQEDFALKNSEVEVLTKEGYSETISSSIILLKKCKFRKIR